MIEPNEKELISFGLTLHATTTPNRRHRSLVIIKQNSLPDSPIFILAAYPTTHEHERIQD